MTQLLRYAVSRLNPWRMLKKNCFSNGLPMWYDSGRFFERCADRAVRGSLPQRTCSTILKSNDSPRQLNSRMTLNYLNTNFKVNFPKLLGYSRIRTSTFFGEGRKGVLAYFISPEFLRFLQSNNFKDIC